MMDPREIPILVRHTEVYIIVNSHLQLAVMIYFGAKIHSSIFSKKHGGLEPRTLANADPYFNTGGSITIPVGIQASRPNRNYASFKYS